MLLYIVLYYKSISQVYYSFIYILNVYILYFAIVCALLVCLLNLFETPVNMQFAGTFKLISKNVEKILRKPTTCIGENKDTDQLCSNCTADQHLSFRYTDSTIPLLLKPKISSFKPSSVTVQSGLCQTWSEVKIFFVL